MHRGVCQECDCHCLRGGYGFAARGQMLYFGARGGQCGRGYPAHVCRADVNPVGAGDNYAVEQAVCAAEEAKGDDFSG